MALTRNAKIVLVVVVIVIVIVAVVVPVILTGEIHEDNDDTNNNGSNEAYRIWRTDSQDFAMKNLWSTVMNLLRILRHKYSELFKKI